MSRTKGRNRLLSIVPCAALACVIASRPWEAPKQGSGDKQAPAASLAVPNAASAQENEHSSETPSKINAQEPVVIRELPPVSVTRDWIDLVSVVFTGTLIIVGGLGVCAAYRTLKIIERQTAETKRAAQAAENSIAIVVGKERPRITVELSEPLLGLEDVPRVNCKIDCWCPTPAFFVDGQIEAFLGGGMPKIPDYLPIYLPNFIRKDETHDTYALIFEKIGPETLNQIQDGRLFVYCHGFVEYRGVHLSDSAPPYKTAFSYKWIPGSKDGIFGTGPGQWEKMEGENTSTKENT